MKLHMHNRHSEKIGNDNKIRIRKKKVSEGKEEPLINYHKFLVPGDHPFYCDHCQMIYTTSLKLQIHFKACHASTVGYLSCSQPECKLEFASKQLLRLHLKEAHQEEETVKQLLHEDEMRREEKEEPKKCPYCDCEEEKVFDTKLSLDFYIGKEYREALLTCVPCQLKFRCYQRYQLHMETKAHSSTKSYSCELCGKGYSDGNRLKIHKRQEHFRELGLDPIACSECGKLMSDHKALEGHMDVVHRKITNFSCEFCGKAFDRNQKLRLHISIYHDGSPLLPDSRHFHLQKGGDDKPSSSAAAAEEKWLCDFCPVIFPNLQAVRTHLLSVHCEQLKYQCEGCGKRYCASLGLHQHHKSCKELLQREGDERKQQQQPHIFPCDFCSKEFNCQSAVYRHQRSVHKDEHPHVCQNCEKVFRSATNLANHHKFNCIIGTEMNTND